MHGVLKAEVSARLTALFSGNNPPEPSSVRLTRLREHYAGCMRCPLATQGRTKVVFGEGTSTAPIMFIGEGPGREEDLLGRPFVGRSGRLLTKLLDSHGFTRDRVFISNTVRCRPPANRPPTPEETRICISHILLQEINIVRPKVVCTLGATATYAFLQQTQSLSAARGRLIETEFFTILPTYHPAYLLRNPAATTTVEADLKLLLPYLTA